MKFKINDKIQFIDLADHIKPSKSYNVTILEAKVRNDGFTEKQLEQLGKILAEALAPIKQDIAEIKSLPTIARELKESKK